MHESKDFGVNAISWLAEQTNVSIQELLLNERVESYEHPYGFTVMRVLGEFVAGWNLRVHFWPPLEMQTQRMARNGVLDQQIHSHGWNLVSRVIFGALHERTFEVVPEPASPFYLHRVHSDFTVGQSRLERENVGVSAVEKVTQVRTGQTPPYAIPADVFHQTQSAGTKWTLSLVMTEEAGTRQSSVLAPSASEGAITNARSPSRDVPRGVLMLAQSVTEDVS